MNDRRGFSVRGLRRLRFTRWATLAVLIGLVQLAALGAAAPTAAEPSFPPSLDSYNDRHLTSVVDVLRNRVEKAPFNLVATLLFFGAIIHTFFTHRFRHIAHKIEDEHRARLAREGRTAGTRNYVDARDEASITARLFHFLGEVEAVFGIWIVPLLIVMVTQVGFEPTRNYINHHLSYNEPLFVVVIMAISSTRPILRLAESCLRVVASVGRGTPVAWWFSILTLGPLLGSLITEPAAMTISALLLARQFFERRPSSRLAYGTIGLLFVNVSVGGTLTHFAAPPVLMVAGRWGWDTPFMLRHFGLEAVLGICLSNALYYF
ncbi:MAG TPA: putative Na+/H+ antiporter, partial [Methylomirabilota bacterium]|nr:putative Na+/H+ antiporter [Methylomirabilota bacterium]